MKVWIINHYAIPPSMGGLVRHYYFSKYLQEKGHEVKIFTSSMIHNTDINMISDGALYKEELMGEVEYTFVRTSNYKGNKLGRIKNMIQFPIRIWRVCKRFEKPDVIYTSSPDLFTACSAVLMAKRMKLPKVVEVRDLWPESIVEHTGVSRKNPVIWFCYKLEKWLYQQADKLIFTMQGGAQYIREKKWGEKFDFSKVEHINNGIDIEEYNKNRELYKLDDEDLLDETTYKVMYVGSVRKANKVGFIVDCAKHVIQSMPEVRFFVWGDGTERPVLEKRCKEEGITNILFKGRVEKRYIPYILSKADVNLFHGNPTGLLRYGGSQNKLFDYLASGQMIVSDIAQAYDLLEEYQCGIFIDKQETEKVEECLLQCKTLNTEEKQKYIIRAQECAGEHDYRVLTIKIDKILKEVRRKNEKTIA